MLWPRNYIKLTFVSFVIRVIYVTDANCHGSYNYIYYYFMNIQELYFVFIGREWFSTDRLRGISSQLLLPELLLVGISSLLRISKYWFIHITPVIFIIYCHILSSIEHCDFRTFYRIQITKKVFEIFNFKEIIYKNGFL